MSRTAPKGGPRMIMVGEILLVVCSLCYLAWWTITFRPSGSSFGGGPFLAGAVLGGLAGIVSLVIGVVDLLPKASAPASGGVVVGGVVVGALLIVLTSTVAHRPITTELPLIILWGTAQLAAGVTLRTAEVLSAPAASAWFVATAIATLVGLVCYLIFYRLEPIPAYWVGMVPLALDGVVAAILAVIVALARVP